MEIQSLGGRSGEHQKGAGRAAVLEPAVLAAVDLDQLAHVFTAVARLVKALALGSPSPDPSLDHPDTQRLARDPQIVAVRELLGRQGWAEVRIVLAHQRHALAAQSIREAIVGGSAAPPICDRSRTAIPKAAPQAVDLTLTDPQQRRSGPWGDTAALKAGQNIDPVEFSFAHQHHAHQFCSLRSSSPKGRKLTF